MNFVVELTVGDSCCLLVLGLVYIYTWAKFGGCAVFLIVRRFVVVYP